ncbi:MAG: hypothetical protein LBN02_04790 [Oscillospiraceae bacterium]|jgi:hypothetical protein|nr:hypothetical protein [Oscillospiraceae bacterium]
MSDRYEFLPRESFGGVKFGTDRAIVRETFGEYKEFKKSEFSINTTDEFSILHAYYDAENKLEAMEVFAESVSYNGIRLFPASKSEFTNALHKWGIEFSVSYGSIISEGLGISAYVPDENEIECVLLYRSGYYR